MGEAEEETQLLDSQVGAGELRAALGIDVREPGRTGYARPVGVDLFSGAGGLGLGFEAAGFDIAVAVKIDPIHCATHSFNFPDCTTICRSVLDIDGDDIRRAAGIGDEEIAVVFGGAPCQGFSMIGKCALDDPRNALVHHFVRLVLELRPACFAFENVKGLTVGKQLQVLEEMIEAFDRGGYRVLLPYRVLNAADYGVPQERHRLFLSGARNDRAGPRYPEPCGRRVTVADVIGDLPEVERFQELEKQDWIAAPFGAPSAYARKLRNLVNDPDDFGYRRAFDRSILTSSARTAHNPVSRKRFAATPFSKTKPVSRLPQLDPGGVCNTIRSGTASDRGAFTSPRPIHPYTPRCITNREAASQHCSDLPWRRPPGATAFPTIRSRSVVAARGTPPPRKSAYCYERPKRRTGDRKRRSAKSL